jgi:membrane protease YdiL (CAAX protease family)
LLLFLILFFKFRIRRSIIILGFTSINFKKNVVLGILTGFIGFLIFFSIFSLLGRDPLSLRLVKAMKDTTNHWYYLTFFFGLFVLFAPLVEEMFFRGI